MASLNYFTDMYYHLILHKVMQFNNTGASFYLELEPDMNGIKIICPVYYGVHFIPSGVKNYVEERCGQYGLDDVKIRISIDEKNKQVLASSHIRFEEMGPEEFSVAMQQFMMAAKLWKAKLKSYEEKDLVYINRKR